MAHAISDAGADVIVGHHPHVLSDIELYNNANNEETVIFYSLGNFIFDQGWTRTKDSAVAQYHINKDGKDRKSTRMNSSHVAISYAVFCWKKQIIKHQYTGR